MDAEKASLAACPLRSRNDASAGHGVDRLSPRFPQPGPSHALGLIVELHERASPWTQSTSSGPDRAQIGFDHVGGPAVVLELFSFVPTAAHAEFYARLVIEAHRLRELIRIATAAIQSAYAKPETPEALIDKHAPISWASVALRASTVAA